MAKKNRKPTKGTKKTNTRPKAKAPAKSKRNWTQWAYARAEGSEPVGENDLLRKAFYGLLMIGSLFIIGLSFPAGINADEKFQDDYAEKLVDYYASFGEDKAALYEGDQTSQRYNKFYGGFFEVLTGGVNRMLGNKPGPSYHRVRHFVNALFGVLILFFTALWARGLGGWRAGIFAIVLVLASPRLLGHAVMNPKDIPFAAGYLIGGYYLYRCLQRMPTPRWQDGLGFILGAALATATRAGGVLVFCYAGLFLGIDFLVRFGFSGIWKNLKQFGRYAGFWIGSTLLGFGLALLFWPYALQAPIEHTQEALKLFSNYTVRIIILFGGENIYSDAIPNTYPLTWLGYTLAISVLLGIIGSIVWIAGLGKRFGRIPVILALFVGLFPLVYIMIQDSALYDGWRQLLFIYPPLLVGAALFYEGIHERVQSQSWGRYAVWGAILLLSADALFFSLRNSAYPYLYFNPVAGGIQGANGQYEMDYWGLSSRQAIQWLEDEGILHAEMQDTLVIGTTFPYNVLRQLDLSYKPKVKVQYVRFHKRYGELWDYGIFPSRFIRGPHLRAESWPTSKSIHTIEVGGVPITTIEHSPQQYAMQAEQLLKQNNPSGAVALFQQELEAYPDNEQAWSGLATAQVTLGQAAEAIQSTDKALELAPKNETALYLKGYANMVKGDGNQALLVFNDLLRVDPENAMAHYMMGEIYRQRGDLQTALTSLQNAVTYNPRLKQGYLLIAQILESQGDTQNAARYREYANQF